MTFASKSTYTEKLQRRMPRTDDGVDRRSNSKTASSTSRSIEENKFSHAIKKSSSGRSRQQVSW